MALDNTNEGVFTLSDQVSETLNRTMSISIQLSDTLWTNTIVPETQGTIPKSHSEVKTISLGEAMKNKLKILAKILQAVHHHQFLFRCVEIGRVPKGFRLQQKKFQLLKSPTNSETHARLNQIYRLSEHSIIKVLIKYYANVRTGSEKALEEVDEGIRQELQHKKRRPQLSMNPLGNVQQTF